MQYPEYFTAEDIMEFEYEYDRYLDIERHEGPFWEINAELQVAADQDREQYYDELERDHDEAYEPDYGDSWYDDQYELDTDYA